MQSKSQILETLRFKKSGMPVHLKTFEYSYWGRLFEYTDERVILKPYYTNSEEQLPLHDAKKDLLLDEIIDID